MLQEPFALQGDAVMQRLRVRKTGKETQWQRKTLSSRFTRSGGWVGMLTALYAIIPKMPGRSAFLPLGCVSDDPVLRNKSGIQNYCPCSNAFSVLHVAIRTL